MQPSPTRLRLRLHLRSRHTLRLLRARDGRHPIDAMGHVELDGWFGLVEGGDVVHDSDLYALCFLISESFSRLGCWVSALRERNTLGAPEALLGSALHSRLYPRHTRRRARILACPSRRVRRRLPMMSYVETTHLDDLQPFETLAVPPQRTPTVRTKVRRDGVAAIWRFGKLFGAAGEELEAGFGDGDVGGVG